MSYNLDGVSYDPSCADCGLDTIAAGDGTWCTTTYGNKLGAVLSTRVQASNFFALVGRLYS
jgi:hypothetical protein